MWSSDLKLYPVQSQVAGTAYQGCRVLTAKGHLGEHQQVQVVETGRFCLCEHCFCAGHVARDVAHPGRKLETGDLHGGSGPRRCSIYSCARDRGRVYIRA